VFVHARVCVLMRALCVFVCVYECICALPCVCVGLRALFVRV
jgi:hypothetical protein